MGVDLSCSKASLSLSSATKPGCRLAADVEGVVALKCFFFFALLVVVGFSRSLCEMNEAILAWPK